jgi:hypothetical protein
MTLLLFHAVYLCCMPIPMLHVMSYPISFVLASQSGMSCPGSPEPGCPVLAVLSWQSCPGSPIPAVLSWQSYSDSHILLIMFCLSSSNCPICMSCLPVVFCLFFSAILFFLYFSACPVLPVLF